MANNYFDFKQFTIRQDHCAMKVGTDGVLLGAWTEIKGTSSALDIGTGTGLIAIMLAQRSSASIEAVEIENGAYHQALENVAACSWHDRIHVCHSSFQDYCCISNKQFDLIVSNPPFFKDSLKAPQKDRSLARHNDMLPFASLARGVASLLLPEGRFAVILPYEESLLFTTEASFWNLYCVRKTVVTSKPEKKPNRVLMEFGRYRVDLRETSLLIHVEDGKYSEAYKELTGDFYL
jgi:tRNA1Val (adenine37-N6)-methyltransferase